MIRFEEDMEDGMYEDSLAAAKGLLIAMAFGALLYAIIVLPVLYFVFWA